MRFSAIFFVVFFFAVVEPAAAQPQPAPVSTPQAESLQAQDAAYLALVDAALQNPAAADFQAIRFAYAKSSFYHPYGGDKIWKELDSAGKAARKNIAQLPAYTGLVRKHFGHYRSHVHAEHLYQLGGDDFARLKPHKDFLAALIGSILKNGEGKALETALQIIDITEEYFLMRNVLRLQRIKKRPTLQQDGHIYDVFDAIDPRSGEKTVIYFNVDRVFAQPL
ncbi:MAG TPA: hypothetical protein PLX33_04245 [Alphaproteobacteria bacterium]|nr:hypothetical protein [Alphaproteobacteria bacterium]